jgi:hypothetical protein
MTVYFLFILLFADKRIKTHAGIIFLACLVPALFPLDAATDVKSYIEKKELYVLYDGCVALILTMALKIDRIAWKQALLLAFASLCHIMIILSIKNAHAGFFYTWYDELIIAVGILQMMVSYDGLIRALSNFQSLLLRTYYYFNRSYQGLFTHKDGGKRT